MEYQLKNERRRLAHTGLGTGAALIAFALVAMSASAQASAQIPAIVRGAKQAPAAVAASAPAQIAGEDEEHAAAPEKAGIAGIKVHGHWVLVVKNPDGSVADQRDFQNSLVTNGANPAIGPLMLGAILTGEFVPGGLGIALITGPATTTGIDASTFCLAPANTPNPGQGQILAPAGISCYGLVTDATSVAGSAFTSPQYGLITTLNYKADPVSPTYNIVLSGNFTVPAGMSAVTAVQSYQSFCAPTNVLPSTGTSTTRVLLDTVEPAQCNLPYLSGQPGAISAAGPLTSTTVAPLPLAVTPGQIISITFTLSFS